MRHIACLLLGALLSAPLSANDDEQTRIAREMIQVLEAYAVYKMGNFDEAFVRYRLLAEAGNRQGMLNLGNMYAAGLGTEVDLKQAFDWYQLAADAGDAIGMYEVARAHDLGLGTESNQDEALRWYRRAAEQDNADAQWTLGERLYQQGQHAAGLSWIRAAARQGEHPQAQQFLTALEGDSSAAIVPGVDQRRAVLTALAKVDQAAQRMDSAALVAPINDDAQIQVRLPQSRSWQRLDKAQLRTLWQQSFAQADDYLYQRNEPELLSTDDGVLAFSLIRETLQRGERTQQLEIRENALLRLRDGQAEIHGLRLDIRQQGE
ncbi:tetratricopeptide repeat protein [Ectopseudomonas mendocina]|uniref:tetratricopeptide repeat protein n=1 Tax=Ectopseudomonas mendocina TaxID=300 RepID=UPI0023EBC4E3|nr:tetratricopeptide repeat protein [Pseudomonas mendocina]